MQTKELSEQKQEEIKITLDRVNKIVSHIRRVQDNCILLGEKLIEQGEINLGRQLIQRGLIHDSSKFDSVEFEYLNLDDTHDERFKIALKQHQSKNQHHPEFYVNGIKEMTELDLCEFVADILARSQQMGTNIKDWLNETALEKYNFTKNSVVYKSIKRYLDLLIDPPFKKVET